MYNKSLIQKLQRGGYSRYIGTGYDTSEVYVNAANNIVNYMRELQQTKADEKEIAIQEEQFNRELKFREDKSLREAQQARHDAEAQEESEKRTDARAILVSGVGINKELAYLRDYYPESSNIPILEEKILTRDKVKSDLRDFSAMNFEGMNLSEINKTLRQIEYPILGYSGEKWADSVLDIFKSKRKNITSKSILDKLVQNPDFKRVVGDAIPSYDISNASDVLASVPAMWTMFSGTNKEKISALKSMLPFSIQLLKDGYPDYAKDYAKKINDMIIHFSGLAKEEVLVPKVVPEKEEAVLQKPVLETDKDYLINPPIGKSFFGSSNQANASSLRGGDAQEIQKFEYTQVGAAGAKYYPGDSGFGKFMAVSNINEPMLIGDEGYTKVVDKDGNVYTWMKQEVEDKRRILNQYLKDSSGKEKKVFNMTFKENYSKLVIQRPDTRIDDIFWNRLNDTERSKFMSNWNDLPVNDRPNFLNIWDKLTDAKKISIIDSM
jgi:hypothetical protein